MFYKSSLSGKTEYTTSSIPSVSPLIHLKSVFRRYQCWDVLYPENSGIIVVIISLMISQKNPCYILETPDYYSKDKIVRLMFKYFLQHIYIYSHALNININVCIVWRPKHFIRSSCHLSVCPFVSVISNSHVNNSLCCSPMVSLWSCKWLPWNTITVSLSHRFIATGVTMISVQAKLLLSTITHGPSSYKKLQGMTKTFPWLDTCMWNSCFFFLHPSVHLPCCSFSLFTISEDESTVTRACVSQRPHQWRNRLCDSVVFSLSLPGVSSVEIEEEGLWNSQSLDPSSQSASCKV